MLQDKVMQLANLKRQVNELNIHVQELENEIMNEKINDMGNNKSKKFKCDNGVSFTLKRAVRNVFNKEKWEQIKNGVDVDIFDTKVNLSKAKSLGIDGLVEEVEGKVTVEVIL